MWNPGGQNYSGTANRTGQNGNISADPKLRNPGVGDYRLSYSSPAIDAADGTVAPATDLFGAARWTTRVPQHRHPDHQRGLRRYGRL